MAKQTDHFLDKGLAIQQSVPFLQHHFAQKKAEIYVPL